MSENEVLLRLKRQYGKDESVKFLIDQLEKAKFQIGELQSEIAELKDTHKAKIAELNLEVKKMGEVQTLNGKTRKQWLQEDVFKSLDAELKALRTKNQHLTKENVRYRDQYLSILAKNNKYAT